jgi:O-antigen/teichoic acid export membrane protein
LNPGRRERVLSTSIRPRRTGALVFGARILSVFTGALFLVMITRSLTTSNFGLWEVIADLVVFASYPAGLLTYWATREVARGKIVGKTTIMLNLLASLLGIGIFIAFALGSYSAVGAGLAPFLVAIILVPLTYWNQSTTALVSGFDPGIGAYSLITSEVAKLLAAFPLLFVFRLNVMGVILAIAVSYFTMSAVSTYMLRPVTRDKVDISIGREWLKNSGVPAVNMLVYTVAVADTFVASLGQHLTTLAGYYQAAYQIALIVGYSSYLSVALYPLLLRDRSDRLPSLILDYSLLFALPMAAGAIALAPKILFLLAPTYVQSSAALVVLSLAQIPAVISTILDQSLTGRETADTVAEGRTIAVLRSDLMFVPAANLVYFALYLTSVFAISAQSVGSAHVYQFAAYWAVAQLVLMVALVAVKAWRLTRKVKLGVPPSLPIYALAGAAMAALAYFLGQVFLTDALGSLSYGLRLVLIVIVGALFYFGVVSLVDEHVRKLVRAGIRVFVYR